MEPVTTPMEKRIRMVRAWLDAAATSYASKGSVKGNFHLFLAQAEMKQMNEGKPSIVSYAQRAVLAIALVGIIGATHWWLSQHETGNSANTPVIDTQVEVQPSKVSDCKRITTCRTIRNEGSGNRGKTRTCGDYATNCGGNTRVLY